MIMQFTKIFASVHVSRLSGLTPDFIAGRLHMANWLDNFEAIGKIIIYTDGPVSLFTMTRQRLEIVNTELKTTT